MASKIFIQNKYIRFVNSVDSSIDTWHLLDNIYFEKNVNTFIFYKKSDDSIIQGLDFSKILDSKGNNYTNTETFIGLLTKKSNNGFPLTGFGEVLTGELSPQFQASFEYTVDNTELNINTVTAGGTVTQSDAMAVITTSTTTGSNAELISKAHAKYKSGLGGVIRFTALFTAGIVGTRQMVGLVDEKGSLTPYKNGFMLGFNGTDFNVHRHRNDVMTSVLQADFDDPLDGSGSSGMTLDPTKINVFEIRFQYLGAGAIEYCIEDDMTGKFIKFHSELYANKNIIPSVFNPNFHFTIYAENGATIDNITVKSASYGYFIEGKTSTGQLHQPQFSSGKIEKTAVTTEVAIFTIRNKTSYQSKTNFIDLMLEFAGASIEASSANNLGEIRLVRNATLGGTPSFTDINTSNSIVEIDIAGTTVEGGKELFYTPLAGKNDRASEDLTPFDIIISPGETVTVAGNSVNSATINSGTLWIELF